MKRLIVTPGALSGSAHIPPSKSHTMRAILFGCMGKGESLIHGYLPSPDTGAMIEAMRALGANITCDPATLSIQGMDGQLQSCENVIDAGNSGQVLRFVGSMAALLPTYTVITGDHSIRHNRPVVPLLSALAQLGAHAVSTRLDGKAPVIVRGPLKPGYAKLCGADSQPVSGLLIAASFLEGTTQLEVTSPGEKPWIDLTLSWLKRLGGRVTHENYERYTVIGPLRYDGFAMHIPGDLSSAAFPLAAAIVTQSPLQLANVDCDDVQGDKQIIDVLQQMGAKCTIDRVNKTLTVDPHHVLQGITIDVNGIIDAIPILAVVGCFAQGQTEIINGAIARNKESDRIHAMALELRKMGARIEEKDDGLIVYHSILRGTLVQSHNDHRIAMALAVAALAAEGTTTIDGVECIAKSYPSFIADFQKLGARMEELS